MFRSSRRATIAGFGDAYATSAAPKSTTELAVEAFRSLVTNTEVKRQSIGAVLTGRAPMWGGRPQWNNFMGGYLHLTPEYSTEITSHGAGVNASLAYAAMMIETQLVDHVLVLVADNVPSTAGMVEHVAALDSDPEYELPYAPSIPAIYAQSASRYLHEFDVTERDLAQVAVQHQAWGIHHPYAAKASKGPITVDTVLQSRLIADPLHLWDCAAWGPYGTGGALLITSLERAKDITEKPIEIVGFGGLNTHEYSTDRLSLRESDLDLGPLPNMLYTGARHASSKAYAMAGVTPSDIDMVQCGNNFTHIAMLLMEDLGFAEKGQAASLVNSGRLGPGGDLPWNTNGGWLSFGQPGISCGMDPLIEAVRQMRGEALGMQVANPNLVLTHALGGMLACHHVTLLARADDWRR